jgi:hypothetical protein
MFAKLSSLRGWMWVRVNLRVHCASANGESTNHTHAFAKNSVETILPPWQGKCTVPAERKRKTCRQHLHHRTPRNEERAESEGEVEGESEGEVEGEGEGE